MRLLAILIICAAIWWQSAATGAPEQCTEFDTALLRKDLHNGYFEGAGLDMAKEVLRKLAESYDCERGH